RGPLGGPPGPMVRRRSAVDSVRGLSQRLKSNGSNVTEGRSGGQAATSPARWMEVRTQVIISLGAGSTLSAGWPPGRASPAGDVFRRWLVHDFDDLAGPGPCEL